MSSSINTACKSHNVHGALVTGVFICLAMVAVALGADAPRQQATQSRPTYSYATNGVVDNVVDRLGDEWKDEHGCRDCSGPRF